jgi:twitching motility protein PilT
MPRLGIAATRGASALYLTTQASPYIRVDADVRVLAGEPPLSSTDVEAAVLELMPDASREAMRRGEPTEWDSELADIGPIRCTTFRDHRGPGAIFQLISMRPISADQLGLADEIQALATEIEGLVLVASPRGSGKTTLVGSLVDLINRQRPAYVITLEKQIRVVHEPGGALISQREVRGTVEASVALTRSALRENPDVLVIEDLSSADMCQAALDAAGCGVLVIVSVMAVSTTAALTRLVELFPQDKRRAVQSLIAERLRGAVAQSLLRKSGGGRVAAREVLLATPAVTTAIGEGQFEHLTLAIASGRKHGMVSLTDALVELVRSGAIDLREAYRKASDRNALIAALKRENLEPELLERLA